MSGDKLPPGIDDDVEPRYLTLPDLELVEIAQEAYLAGPISGTNQEKWLRAVRAIRAAITGGKHD